MSGRIGLHEFVAFPKYIMYRVLSIVLVVAAIIGVPTKAESQGTIVPFITQQFLSADGTECSGCLLDTWQAGTTPALATYSNSTLAAIYVNANPVVMDSAGRPTTGAIYLSAVSYAFRLRTAAGATLWTLDPVSAIPTASGNVDVTGTAGEAITAGQAVYLSDGSGALTAGRWYLTDSDNTYSSTTGFLVGIAPTEIASAASGSIRLVGRVTGLSGLTAGELYYASATAGALTGTPPTNARFIGKADSTTSLVLGGGQGGVGLPDSDGTHTLSVRTSSNLTADRLLTFVTGDAARTVTISGDATIGGDNPINVVEGRLTLTTATPVTTADVTAATTLYWAIYTGSRISLYTGTAWTVVALAQLSIAVPATTNTMYDVFIDYTAGVPVLEAVAWTNDTTRATALALQDGVYVQTADADSRYVGSIRTTGVSGQTEDSFAKRYVWNYYNRVPRAMRVVEATDSWGYTTETLRQANGATGNQLDFIVGVAEVSLSAFVMAMHSNDTAGRNGIVGIGIDSTSAVTAGGLFGYNTSAGAGFVAQAFASLTTYPAIGRHTAVWLEWAAAGTGITTWYGDAATPTLSQSGISGWIEG